jgi:hypothetical protein
MFFCGLVATGRRLQAAWQAQPVLVRVALGCLAGEALLTYGLGAALALNSGQPWYSGAFWGQGLGAVALLCSVGLGLTSYGMSVVWVLLFWRAKHPMGLLLVALFVVHFPKLLLLACLWRANGQGAFD